MSEREGTDDADGGLRHALRGFCRFLGERLRLLALLRPHRGLSVVFCLLQLFIVLTPAATALATGWLVSRLTEAVERDGGVGGVVAPLTLVSLLLLASETAAVARVGVQELLSGRVDGRVRQLSRELASRPGGIGHLEDPRTAGDLVRIAQLPSGVIGTVGSAAVGQCTLTFRLLGALAATCVVAWYLPWLAIGLLVASLVMRATIRRQWLRLAYARDARTDVLTRMRYWSDLASTSHPAKEVRLFGLARFVVARRSEEARAWGEELWTARTRTAARQHVAYAAAFGSAAASLYVTGRAATHDRLTVSELFVCLIACWGIFEISSMGREAYDIDYGVGALRSFERLSAAVARASAEGHPDADVPRSPTVAAGGRGGPPAVRFADVTFGYPGKDVPVLDGLDLRLAPGRVTALVGPNGVGKTSLVKLLTGLYAPSRGSVSVDGVDLAALDLASWRRRVAVLFQDFNRYPLSVADNIVLGAPEHRSDRAGIRAAAASAGIDALVGGLPLGYDTPLGREVTEGLEVSGGQWQKLALARVLFAAAHGRDLIVLDEPTAHLDVEAEASFYQKVISTVRGKTVVLISHRLSTVRHADHIVLLHDGRIAEEGDHQHLIERNGRYARLFGVQASAFGAERIPARGEKGL